MFYNLLDVTPDNHEDLKGVVEVVSTLGKLIELCDDWTASAGLSTELRQMVTQLQWKGEEDPVCSVITIPQLSHKVLDVGVGST